LLVWFSRNALVSVNKVIPHWAISTWMGDRLRVGKPSQYVTATEVNSAFHPSIGW